MLFLAFQSTALFAQTKKTTVSGFVRDSSTNKALEFATISLFQNDNFTQAVKSTYTKDNGKFQLSDLDSGNYTLVISYTGFSEKQLPLQIGATTQELNIVLSSTAGTTLKGVTIVARRPLVEQSDDKVTFNVENDPSSKTQTAIDILRKTPFVSVDGEGNVQVNGQSNFRVLLNGRETAMFAQNVKEALKSFPGNVITKIEVITSPSAKYDAEGVGGIINIITKKKVVGYNGSIFSSHTNTGWHNYNASFSAKFGKVGATVNYGGGYANNIKGSTRTETTPFTPTIFTNRILEGRRTF
jgi:hypothetical protein